MPTQPITSVFDPDELIVLPPEGQRFPRMTRSEMRARFAGLLGKSDLPMEEWRAVGDLETDRAEQSLDAFEGARYRMQAADGIAATAVKVLGVRARPPVPPRISANTWPMLPKTWPITA
jgi:hypothetical protein